MITILEVTLPFAAIGKPRMTQRDKWAKRPCVVRYRAWADEVRRCVKEECRRRGVVFPNAKQVMDFSWTAIFAMKPGTKRKPRPEKLGDIHRDKPDRDNIDKGLNDILFGKDDSAIGPGRIDKRWGIDDMIQLKIIYIQ